MRIYGLHRVYFLCSICGLDKTRGANWLRARCSLPITGQTFSYLRMLLSKSRHSPICDTRSNCLSYVFYTALLTRCKNKTSLPYLRLMNMICWNKNIKCSFQLNFMAVALLEEISVWSRCLSHSANKEQRGNDINSLCLAGGVAFLRRHKMKSSFPENLVTNLRSHYCIINKHVRSIIIKYFHCFSYRTGTFKQKFHKIF
jgi:hypothetical protein